MISVNDSGGRLEIRILTIFEILRLVAGSMGQRLIHQVYDVPSIILFIVSCKNLCKKLFQFIFISFYNFRKIERMSFECSKSIRNYERK